MICTRGHFAWRRCSWSCTTYDIDTLQCIYKEGGCDNLHNSGHRQYSVDLEQRGLDVPCKLQFQGSQTTIDKLSKMLLNASVPAADSKPTTALINQPQNSELYYVYKPVHHGCVNI